MTLKCSLTGTEKSFYLTTKNNEDQRLYIDATSYVGTDLGNRRLNMLVDNIELYPLKLAIYSLGELLKVATPSQWFIDSKGALFQYKKTHYVPIVYKEIIQIQKLSGFETIIMVHDSPPVYKALYPPTENEKYAVFLQVSPKALLFYGYSETKHKNKRKKI